MRIISTAEAPTPPPFLSQAIRTGDLLFCSGQIGLDPATKSLVTNGAANETAQILKNIRAVLEAAGTDWSSVVKATIYLTDMADYAAVNDVYATALGPTPPARTAICVAALPLGARVEIEVIAELPSA